MSNNSLIATNLLAYFIAHWGLMVKRDTHYVQSNLGTISKGKKVKSA